MYNMMGNQPNTGLALSRGICVATLMYSAVKTPSAIQCALNAIDSRIWLICTLATYMSLTVQQALRISSR